MQDVLTCRNISKTYHDGNNQTPVLNDVSLSIKPSEHVAILGSSGSGKSTLLHLLGGLDSPSEGDVLFKGQSLYSLSSNALADLRNRDIGFIYQFHHLLAEFSALENVMMPLLIRKEQPAVARAAGLSLLEQVGLAHRAEHLPSALSGGERQRVAIARALVTKPSVVLADEPTGNLDFETGQQVYALLKSLSDSHDTSFVVVTHDRELANQLDRTLFIKNGRLIADRAEEANA